VPNYDGFVSELVEYLFNELLTTGDRRHAMLRSGYPDGGSTVPAADPIEGVYPEAALPLARVGRVLGIARDVLTMDAREAAKAEVFSSRTAPEVKEIFGWGNGLEGVQAARGALDSNRMAQIQGSMTRSEVESWRNFYNSQTSQGRGGAVAPQRAGYMTDILKRW
jgi:hypothetical protein